MIGPSCAATGPKCGFSGRGLALGRGLAFGRRGRVFGPSGGSLALGEPGCGLALGEPGCGLTLGGPGRGLALGGPGLDSVKGGPGRGRPAVGRGSVCGCGQGLAGPD